jgi:hypothetical protein
MVGEGKGVALEGRGEGGGGKGELKGGRGGRELHTHARPHGRTAARTTARRHADMCAHATDMSGGGVSADPSPMISHPPTHTLTTTRTHTRARAHT